MNKRKYYFPWVEDAMKFAIMFEGEFHPSITSLIFMETLTVKSDDEVIQYSYSWDWLMPVVEKINNMGTYSAISIDPDCVFVHFDRNTHLMDIKNSAAGSKIQAVYKGVVSFIKWHQSQLR